MTDIALTVDQLVRLHFEPLVARDAVAPGLSPGLLVGVVHDRARYCFGLGELPLCDGAGAAPAVEDLVFMIGSNTKVFTATLLALSELGELPGSHARLDTRVSELLPVGVTLHEFDGDPITLRHLATHTAGYPKGPCPPYTFGNYAFDASTRFLASFQPHYPPGRRWFYSNQGFALLGALLAGAWADPRQLTSAGWGPRYWRWPQLAMRRLVEPLGLSSTQVGYAAVRDRLLRSFAIDGGQYAGIEPAAIVMDSAALGAGALSSTLADMLSFLQRQFAPSDDALGRAIALTQLQAVDDLAMGLGWQLGEDLLYKDGLVQGYSSFMTVDPRQRVGVFAFANSRDGNAGQALRNSAFAVLDGVRGGAAQPGPLTPPQRAPQCP
ncbi:serine hydrolase [Lysobacter enzymogenes]|uniref:serine hydrolase domain-containing protein n=1 Tax=Lysobacter enzymogenes TaxID=69 RepID=UPI00374A845F